jgi:hypothetical protein
MSSQVSVESLLSMRLDWKKASSGRWEAVVHGVTCFLLMNDFPEEPLFTVIVGGESLDLEASPPDWRIDYEHAKP